MLIWVWPRSDATGLLDDEFKDGDAFQTQDDSYEPLIGGLDKKAFLIIKIPDPPNKAAVAIDLVRPEYAPGSSPGENVVRRKRIFYLDWRAKFSAAEIALIEDANAQLADGSTQGGGTVVGGVLSDLFTIQDFSRK